MITEKRKDITTVTKGVIVHGCNCSGGFGAGVAKAIKIKWPEVERQFRLIKSPELGTVYAVKISNELYVCNGYTQSGYGYGGAIYADVDSIRSVIQTTIGLAKQLKIRNIYLPKIGCGLGGLKWETDVLPIFNDIDHDRLNIVICTL